MAQRSSETLPIPPSHGHRAEGEGDEAEEEEEEEDEVQEIDVAPVARAKPDAAAPNGKPAAKAAAVTAAGSLAKGLSAAERLKRKRSEMEGGSEGSGRVVESEDDDEAGQGAPAPAPAASGKATPAKLPKKADAADVASESVFRIAARAPHACHPHPSPAAPHTRVIRRPLRHTRVSSVARCATHVFIIAQAPRRVQPHPLRVAPAQLRCRRARARAARRVPRAAACLLSPPTARCRCVGRIGAACVSCDTS